MKRVRFLKGYTTPMSRMRQARGFGIHSPFAFRLVTQVIREKSHYYAYDDIEAIVGGRVDNLDSARRRIRRRIPKSYGRLLFRLANFFQPGSILEIGSAWGVSSLYLRCVNQATELTVVEPDSEVREFAQSLFNDGGKQARFVAEDFESVISSYISGCPHEMFIVVNRFPALFYPTLSQWITPALEGRSLLIVDGIRSSAAAKQWWEELRKDPRVSVTIDLKKTGIVCCDKKLNKQNYQVTL